MKKWDFLLIISVLAVAAVGYLLLGGGDTAHGDVAVVSIDGERRDVLRLSEDGEYHYSTAGGENTVVVSDGAVSVSDSDCPDRYCVRQGSISRTGDSIVCLPHRLVIEISASADGVDAVAE